MAGMFGSQYDDTKVMIDDLSNLSQMNTAAKADSEGVMKPPKGEDMDAGSWWAWLSGYTRQKTQENVARVQEELASMGVDTTGLSPEYQQSMLEGIAQARAYRDKWGITTALGDAPTMLEEQGVFPQTSVEQPVGVTEEVLDAGETPEKPSLMDRAISMFTPSEPEPDSVDTSKPDTAGIMDKPVKTKDTKTSYSMNNAKMKKEFVLGYLADFEGTQAHSSLEGGADTAAYGVKNSMGLDRKDFKTDADFAAAVAFKHYNAAGKNFKETNRNIKVWSDLGDAGRYAVTDLHYNVGTIGSTGQKSTPKAALENTLEFIGMTTKDKTKVSLLSLATRRAKNWNKAAGDLGLTKIAKVQQIPTKKGTTFEYLDEDGNSVYTVESSRKAVSLKSDGSYNPLTETREEEL